MTSGVNERMALVVYDNLAVSIEETPAKSIAQGVVNAAWTNFDPEDENTWPEQGLYLTFSIMEIGGKPCKSIERNYFCNGKWNTGDDVVCYTLQELLEPVL